MRIEDHLANTEGSTDCPIPLLGFWLCLLLTATHFVAPVVKFFKLYFLEATLPAATHLAGFSKLNLVKLVQHQLSSFLQQPALPGLQTNPVPKFCILDASLKGSCFQGTQTPWVSATVVSQTIHGMLQY